MQVLVFLTVCLPLVTPEDDGSYSFYKFRGPVSGQIHQIQVPSHYHNQHYSLDYVAKPDYLYSYGVEDPVTGNSQAHKETRDGDSVLGEYKVLQADGILRIVKYTADGTHGFRATVEYVKP
ncbi:cuticle protein 8-like [Tribolium madens]|uniref:cuticle protein 8-like n=1 Tax=Tribolium madens TaxID=41895 RepID=UPI001CF75791|nr:cuticle protein 8-like [Tribolium madens]